MSLSLLGMRRERWVLAAYLCSQADSLLRSKAAWVPGARQVSRKDLHRYAVGYAVGCSPGALCYGLAYEYHLISRSSLETGLALMVSAHRFALACIFAAIQSVLCICAVPEWAVTGARRSGSNKRRGPRAVLPAYPAQTRTPRMVSSVTVSHCHQQPTHSLQQCSTMGEQQPTGPAPLSARWSFGLSRGRGLEGAGAGFTNR